MVLHGKERAIEEIPKSTLVFISKITDVQRRYSTVSMPPIDHYTLQFDHDDLRTLRGRVYRTMTQFDYAQRGEGISSASNDIHHGIRKVHVRIPTVNHLYVVCLNGTKEITHLIEINRLEAEEICKRFT